MYARFRARRRRRPAIAALGVALVLVLGACDTQPATEVTHNSAVLNARGACYGTMNGIWQYELRRVGGPWNSVGPLHPFACGASGAETPIQSHRATGLVPNTTYQYRIRAYENNSAREYYFDSTGADRGTNYDQFTTLPSYPTSARYGGANGRVDTAAEALAVVEALMSAGSDAASDALASGLAPSDREYVRPFLNSRLTVNLRDSGIQVTVFGTGVESPTAADIASFGPTEGASAAAGTYRCKRRAFNAVTGDGVLWQHVRWCFSRGRQKARFGNVNFATFDPDDSGEFFNSDVVEQQKLNYGDDDPCCDRTWVIENNAKVEGCVPGTFGGLCDSAWHLMRLRGAWDGSYRLNVNGRSTGPYEKP
jgi:hypothetical protein